MLRRALALFRTPRLVPLLGAGCYVRHFQVDGRVVPAEDDEGIERQVVVICRIDQYILNDSSVSAEPKLGLLSCVPSLLASSEELREAPRFW